MFDAVVPSSLLDRPDISVLSASSDSTVHLRRHKKSQHLAPWEPEADPELD